MVRCRRQTGQRRSSRGSEPREPPCRSQSQPSFPPSPAPVLSVLESASAQSNRPPENARADAATIFQENATFNPIAPPAASTPPTAVRALCHQFNPASNSQSPAPFPGDPPLDWKPPELLAARAWAICIPDARAGKPQSTQAVAEGSFAASHAKHRQRYGCEDLGLLNMITPCVQGVSPLLFRTRNSAAERAAISTCSAEGSSETFSGTSAGLPMSWSQ